MTHRMSKVQMMASDAESSNLSRLKAHALELDALTVLLVTDLEAFTALLSRLGDARARTIIRSHDGILRLCLNKHRGVEIAHTGDGMVAAFRSVKAALACAIAMQRSFATQAEHVLRVRIGLHAGEPVAEDGRLFGICVNTTVRICGAAPAGSIYVSNLVRELAAGHKHAFRQRGAFRLKGLDELDLHELLWQPQASEVLQPELVASTRA